MELEFIPKKHFMELALKLAQEAAESGEVPVGAVIERDGEIISYGRNMREEKQSVISHAEIEAIELACKNLGTWRLSGCNMYVTLEPCPMCMGAAINSRLDRIIYAADDEIMGACMSKLRIDEVQFPNTPKLYRGFMEEESKALLKDFFSNLRK